MSVFFFAFLNVHNLSAPQTVIYWKVKAGRTAAPLAVGLWVSDRAGSAANNADLQAQ